MYSLEYDFKITDIYGQTLEEYDIPLKITTELPGTQQFPILKGSSSAQSPRIIHHGKNNGITVQFTMNHKLVIRLDHQQPLHFALYTPNGKKIREMDLADNGYTVIPIHACGLYFLFSEDCAGRISQMTIPVFY